MEKESKSTSEPGGWLRSATALELFSIILPPVGLCLLWLRRTTETGKKVFGSMAIVAWGAAYAYLLFFSGLIIIRQPDMTAHYDRLEQQRASQRESGEPGLAPSNSNSAETAPTTSSANSNTAIAAAPGTASRTTGNYWTSYRGRDRDGNYDEVTVRTDWPGEGLPALWKQPIGGGYASFAVAGGVAFTIEQRRNQEVAAAYDIRTGRELWVQSWQAEFKESMGGNGPRATPTWDSGRVYALGALGDFYCLDAKTGKPVWSKNILKDAGAQNLQWGVSASPLIVDDKVIVIPGGASGCVVAYNKVTGAPVWKSLRDQAAYASPMLVTLAGKRQILAMTAERIVGLNPQDGALLWEYPWPTFQGINAAQPIVVDQNRVFISAGYGKGASLLELNASNNGLATRVVWENNAMKNKFNSSVFYQGFIYGLDEGILTCIDATSGERKWKGGRYGYGQVTLASGHLIVTTDDGDVVLVKATPSSHSEAARFGAIEGKTWNCPAISGGLLLVRNETEMACFDLSAM